MKNPILLNCPLDDGTSYEAVFLPSHGMNLASFTRGGVEVIDPSTKEAFEERYAGLGPLIGPHFHRRRPELVSKVPDEALFPHIARCTSKGILDPFSHGVARYCPWNVEVKGNEIKGEISGKDLWNGVALSAIEGQNFVMKMVASLTKEGLFLDLSVVSDTDSLVGIHYYYRLPQGKFRVISGGETKLDRDEAIDSTFFPSPNPLKGEIFLETEEYTLKTTYDCPCQENSWQLYHPKNSSFVCIEPLSASDPRHPNLTVSSLSINLQILPGVYV